MYIYMEKKKKKDDTLAWSTRHMERSARSRLERGREAEKEESRKGKRLLVSTLDSLILSVVFDIRTW